MNSSNRTNPQTLLDTVTRQYLGSRDFNGYPTRELDDSDSDIRAVLAELVSADLLSLNFGDRHPNPHVLALDPEPIAVQLEKLKTADLHECCLYPTKPHLATVIESTAYSGCPFRRALALGEPQLSFRFFELKVLETYRNDPRFSFETDQIQGHIGIRDEFYESDQTAERDKVLLQQFGFGYDKSLEIRVVAVLLSDLAGLSAGHQQIWAANELTGDFFPHPGFHGSVMGHWPEKVSLFQAFLQELKEINAMSLLMGREPFFRQDFSGAPSPREFGFLIRPTLAEYNAFVHLLDKLISENINIAFFQNEVSPEIEEQRTTDGTKVVRPKGTLRVFGEWLDSKISFPDPDPKNKMMATFKKIRRLRQVPAHAVNENVFDQKYFRQQRELVIEAYKAVRSIRLIFANDPRTKAHVVEDWLYKGEIWFY